MFVEIELGQERLNCGLGQNLITHLAEDHHYQQKRHSLVSSFTMSTVCSKYEYLRSILMLREEVDQLRSVCGEWEDLLCWKRDQLSFKKDSAVP